MTIFLEWSKEHTQRQEQAADLHCAAHGETVSSFGRNDDSFGVVGGEQLSVCCILPTALVFQGDLVEQHPYLRLPESRPRNSDVICGPPFSKSGPYRYFSYWRGFSLAG